MKSTHLQSIAAIIDHKTDRHNCVHSALIKLYVYIYTSVCYLHWHKTIIPSVDTFANGLNL